MNGNPPKARSARPVIAMTVVAAIVLILAVVLQTAPGYMDAEYYFAGGLRLTRGFGFTEPFLWNYLDQPQGLPHASHTYWMPLASILAAIGMAVTGASTFLAARWPFMFLAGLIPWVTYQMAIRIGAKPATARLAGWLAVFPGFYLVFTTLTETFVLYMLGGALFFLTLSLDGHIWKTKFSWLRYGILGLLAAWMHASRADGILWLGMAGLIWLVESVCQFRSGNVNWRRITGNLVMVFLLYGLVMGAWYARNLELYGTLLSPGGSRTLWLTEYDQTFLYPADRLTVENWLAAGWPTILQARWIALGMNLKNILAVQALVFLLPLIGIGAWHKRSLDIIRFGAIGWLMTLVLMTIVFPFSGSRGGFLHSGAAFQPLLWACAALGLETSIDAGVKKRGWRRSSAWRVFSAGVVVLAAVITAGVFWARVVQPGTFASTWTTSQRNYQTVGEAINRFEIPAKDLFVVNNPPGFYLATSRPSIVIPDGDEQNLLAVASRYGAKFLILDPNNPKLTGLYQAQDDHPNFILLDTVGLMKIYQIQPQP